METVEKNSIDRERATSDIPAPPAIILLHLVMN
jgi:hypothetical protein